MAVATMYNFFSLGWAVTLACIQGLVQQRGSLSADAQIQNILQGMACHPGDTVGDCHRFDLRACRFSRFVSDRNWRTFQPVHPADLAGQPVSRGAAIQPVEPQRGSSHGSTIRVTEQGKPMMEQLAARWVMAFSMVLIGVFSLITFLPSPANLPGYARFLPIDLSPQQILKGSQITSAVTTPGTTLATTPGTTTTPKANVTVESANCRASPGEMQKRSLSCTGARKLKLSGGTTIPGIRGGISRYRMWVGTAGYGD